MQRRFSELLLALGIAVSISAFGCASSFAAASGKFIASNCAPVGAATNGTMVWYSKNSAGVWDAYIGNGNCQGEPLLPAYDGNRGPAAITPNGRYVLLTTAVGWEKTLSNSAPGEGSQNEIQLYDRQTGKLSTLLAGATSSQRGVIWPAFNSTDTKIVWSQMVKTGTEDPPNGEWALHVADVNLEAGTLSNNVEWQDPDGKAAFYEAYGWIPNTNQLIFASNTRSTEGNFRGQQLWTLPESLEPGTAPTRVSPEFAPVWPWQTSVNVFHEFAHFAPNEPNTLYTSIGANTVGGDDLFSYSMKSQGVSGLLGQPTRISYFGGDLNANWGTSAIGGWPTPAYTVVTTMAWVNGEWVATTCPNMLCTEVNAWRIEPTGGSGGEGGGKRAEEQAPSEPEPPAGIETPGSPVGSAGSSGSAGSTGTTGAAGTSPTGTTTSAPTTSPTSTSSAGHVTLVGSKLTVSHGHAAIELRCSEQGLCAGKLTLSAKEPAHAGRGRRTQVETFGTAAFTLLPGTSNSVKVSVSRAGKALLAAQHGDLNATLTISSAGASSIDASTPVAGALSRMLVHMTGPPSSWL
jgi:hypothetical protein